VPAKSLQGPASSGWGWGWASACAATGALANACPFIFRISRYKMPIDIAGIKIGTAIPSL